MTNTIINFENELGTIRTTLLNEEAYFVAKDVAEALGYKNTRDAIAKYVDEEDKANVAIHDGSQNRQQVAINESGLYSLIFGSKLPHAKEFKRWVTKEVLPAIRQRGCFITESAEEETVIDELKYGKYRIRKHFSSLAYKDIEEEYDNALTYIQNNYTPADRLTLLDSMNKGLETVHSLLAEDVLNIGKCYDIQQKQKQLIQIRSTTKNRINGGQKAQKTRLIKKLEQTQDRTPDLSQFYKINYHGFSTNYCFQYLDGRTVRTKAYNNWIKNFPVQELPNELDFDPSLPTRLYIYYTAKAEMDVKNMDKSFIDRLQDLYSFNDNIIDECICKRHETCHDYKEGEIYFHIENIDTQSEGE